jgi:hypothetical protein
LKRLAPLAASPAMARSETEASREEKSIYLVRKAFLLEEKEREDEEEE